MPRAIWNGVITFGMVSIPVGLTTAVQEKDVHFHQVHGVCGSRIRYQKFCPVCDRVVTDEELKKGYEVAKGRYVLMEAEDFEGLPVPSQHAIEVAAFVKAEEIDPIYYDRSYYVEPEAMGRKPFSLLMRALKEKGVNALAKIALRSKESLCVLRPMDGVLVLETLYYPEEIRKPSEKASPEESSGESKEFKMALSLIDLLSEEFDPAKYEDEYRKALLHRIEEKAEGHQVEQPPTEAPESNVIDLMEALRRSVEEAKKGKEKEPAHRKAS